MNMLNKLRSKIEAKRNSNNSIWRMLIRIKDFLAYKMKGKISARMKNKKEVEFYKSFIDEGNLVFDVGANLGEKTNAFLMCKAKVIAVEPQKECLEVLKAKYDKNKNVQIIPNGLAAESGSSIIYTSKSSNTVSTFSKEWQKGRFENQIVWDGEESIEMLTIENLIQEFGVPKFCKIDVEGYELEVVKGLKSKIPIISFEFAEEFLENTLKIISILEDIGYTHFNFAEEEHSYFNNIKWLSKVELLKYFEDNIDADRGQVWGDIYAK
jgi:FkbM family methyltransferase